MAACLLPGVELRGRESDLVELCCVLLGERGLGRVYASGCMSEWSTREIEGV